MASLGGARAIGEACFETGNAPPIELRCRPSDPLSHPLYGERASTSGLVLRISRGKRQRTASPTESVAGSGDVRVEAVGRVTHVVQFRGMADFQHTRAAEDPALASNSGVATAGFTPGGVPFSCGIPDGPRSDPFRLGDRAEAALAGVPAKDPQDGRVGSLVMVPPIYSKVDEPEAYGIGTGGGGSRRGGISDDVDFTEGSVPPRVDQSADTAGCPSDVLAALEGKLDARPVWAHHALLEVLPEAARGAAKKALPFLAYRFANGPFRKLWIKRGVDPRADVSFAKYQIHEMRLPSAWYEGGSSREEQRGEARTSTSHGEVHRFEALPKSRYVVYQLCDIELPGVQAVLSSLAMDPNVSARCKEQLGFLTAKSHKRIQACLKGASEALYLGNDPVAAEVSALSELEREEAQVEEAAASKGFERGDARRGVGRVKTTGEGREEEEEEEEGWLAGGSVAVAGTLHPDTTAAVEAQVFGGKGDDIEELVRRSVGAVGGAALDDDMDEYDVFGDDDEDED